MRYVGYAVDVAMVAAVAYLASRHPGWAWMEKHGGLVPALAALPTPVTPGNATGFVIDVNTAAGGLMSPDTAATAQAWYNYVLGDDQGSAQTSPDLSLFLWFDDWANSMILPKFMQHNLPHFIANWARNMLAGWLLYWVTGAMWALWMYVLRAKYYYPNPDDMPTWKDISLQISVSNNAMIFYTLAPTVGEWAIERGLTWAYHDLATVGGPLGYVAWLVAYFTFVEWAIYWIHRLLHDIHFLYNWLHKTHHIYNNRNSLSPFAGLAFDPIDGLMQASPYVIGLFLMPVHFWTQQAALFFTGIWTTNVHDTLTGDTEPIMGSAYHTIHHTTYRNNYGQFFVLFDWLHDTLAPPPHRREQWGWTTATGRKESDYNIDYATGKRKVQ